MIDKIDKNIVKSIHRSIGDRNITFDDFKSLYLGHLMFYFHDTFGLPSRSVLETFNRVINGHI